jgi:nucleotide-binding universal stress UspA family protein
MKLVVAVDFSDVTPRLIETARAQVAGREARLWLVHVVEPEPDFVGYEAGPDVVRDQVAHEMRDERHQLEVLAKLLRADGLDVTPKIVQGPTVDAILGVADDQDADLIILGTHGRGVVYQMLVGSTSEGILRNTTRPILLVPAVPV